MIEPLRTAALTRVNSPEKNSATHGLFLSMLRRSEEHTSELQSPCNLVCRFLLEKKKHPFSNGHYNCCKSRQRYKLYPGDGTAKIQQIQSQQSVTVLLSEYFFFLLKRRPPKSPLFPYTPPFR